MKTALIVEDDVTQALSLRLLLENAGMSVLHAANGGLGLETLRQLKLLQPGTGTTAPE